jgi:deoxyribodipyrimidine photo-lyase
MLKPPLQCVWLKRDLRLRDHRPLVEASRAGPVLLLYIIEPELIAAPDFDGLHWEFIRQALVELAASVRERGGMLCIQHGEATEVLAKLHLSHAFVGLWSHEETGNALTYERDQRVARWARAAGVNWQEFSQNGVVRRLRDRDGWARIWEARMAEPLLEAPAELRRPMAAVPSAEIPSCAALGLSQQGRAVDVRGGERAGLRVLQSFIEGRGQRYHREMSSPNQAYQSCSRLSPYLAWGCLSLRTAYQGIATAAGTTMPKIAARAVISRLHWHCHFIQKLESEPAIERHAFNRVCDTLRADFHDSARLEAWQQARTGYPFVDACLRALKARGWINFRMRAMLVSFASYHLWLDWRCFKDWLACQFIDYEPGIHIAQIQMQSGLTGINSLRIYNPIKQGMDHDPDGRFIREWVPELRGVSNDFIHDPWMMPELIQAEARCRLGVDYPMPIVEHREAVQFARARFTELRKRRDYREAARGVMLRHGSRKGARGRSTKRSGQSDQQQCEFNFVQ